MKQHLPIAVFVLAEILVSIFIVSTVNALPENTASHFNGNGSPNGFMSQQGYLIFMLIFAVGIPTMIVGGITAALRSAPNYINIPNREFWLTPEKKQQTIQFLYDHIIWLGVMLAVFVGYIHWLILKANSVQPAHLSNGALLLGTGLFLVCVFSWCAMLFFKFRRIPRA